MIKILHISTTIEWRGGDKGLLTTFENLRDYPDLKQYILAPKNSVLLEKCNEQGVPSFSASRKSKFSIPFLKKMQQVVRQKKIDVVHVHDSIALTLALCAFRGIPQVKLVYIRKRNNPVKNNFIKRIKYNNHLITSIICVSQAVKNVLVPVLNNPEIAQVIYDGIDVKKFSSTHKRGALRRDFSISSDTFLIGNIAGLTKQKDLFTFLNAAKLILENSNAKIQFIIIGEGPQKEQLKAHALKLKIEKEVIFAGFRKDIPSILPELDLFLLSSETEGLPLSVMEAFASKVPVVATAAGGTGEAVKNRMTGMISPVKDAEKLSKNVLELMQDHTLRQEVITNAFGLVHEKFSLEVMKENYYNFYKNLF